MDRARMPASAELHNPAPGPQIGATVAIGDKWFVDMHYSKSNLRTTTTFSTGQKIDIALDPVSYGIAIGYKF